MLKHVLRTVHPILIFEDIDNPKRTVTLERALTRLAAAGISISNKERVNILRASTQRNNVVHYEFELNRFECRKIYAQLFEFVHFFHAKHLKSEIHARISHDHWPVEARLMTFFHQNFVLYNGVEMFKENPTDIVRNQSITFFEIDGQRFDRIAYGTEPGWLKYNPEFADFPCHDCGVVKGQYHADGCDVEECPKHHGQLLGCGCG
jgi:hypothetical protein